MTSTDSASAPSGSGDQPAGDQSGSSMFASFAVVPFRIIWLGTFLYYLSIFTGIIARGALAKELGGTNTALGVVTLAFGATSLLFTPLGGVMADRFPKRRVMIASTTLLAITSGWLGVTELLDITQFWMLIVVSSMQAVAFSLLVPARMAYTVELVGPGLIPNAVALSQVSMNFNRVLGPAVAGAMLGVAWLSFQAIYLSAALLGVLSAVCFSFLGPGNPDPSRPERAPLAEMVEGLNYARSNTTIRLVMILAIAITMVGFPYVAFLPSVSEDFFQAGASGYAQLSLVGAVGGLIAGLFIARAALAQGRSIQFWSAIGIGLSLIFLGWAPTLAVAGLATTLLGAATAGFQSMNGTMALSAADPSLHGRVQSLLGLGFSAFGLASLPLGVLADAIGLRVTLALMGATVILIAVVVQFVWSSTERRQAEPIF
ncbi:MAG: MFS transporter [Acidimicrobiales bacterium]